MRAQYDGQIIVNLDKKGHYFNNIFIGHTQLKLYKYNALEIQKLISQTIKFPEFNSAHDTAIALLTTMPLGKKTFNEKYKVLLIINSNTTNPIFYVNDDSNYDFKSSKPIRMKNDKCSFSIGTLQYTIYQRLNTEDTKKGADFYNDPFNLETFERKYCYVSENNNINIGEIKLQDKKIQLGIADFNHNGLYNEVKKDIVLIGRANQDTFFQAVSVSSRWVDLNNYIEIGSANFKIIEIDPQGKYIKLSKVNDKVSSPLKLLEKLPCLEFETLAGTKNKFCDYIGKGKYLYVKIWGTWCAPCIAEVPQLRELNGKYKEKLTMISLAFHNQKSDIKEFVRTHNMSWIQGMSTDNINEELLQNGFPYGILFDEKGNLIRNFISADEVEKELNKK